MCVIVDVNECLSNANNCNDESSSCLNTIGSYVCNCKSGFEVSHIQSRNVDLSMCRFV